MPTDPDPTTPLLLIGGAGLPPWIWEDLQAALPAERPTVVAPRPSVDGPRALDDYAAVALASAPWPSFVVVGHSIGGVVATRIAERAPERLAGVIGVCASFPAPGRSFFGALPFPQRAVVGGITRVLGTRPPAKVLRAGLARGLPDATAERVVTEFAPESQALYRDPVGTPAWPRLRGYLRTAEDPEMPLAHQDGHAATLRADRVATIGTGHLPMLADASGTAAALERLLA